MLRLFCVMRALAEPLALDLDLARTRALDNPLYSIQYAYARVMSVRRQLEDSRRIAWGSLGTAALDLLTAPEERALVREVAGFPDALDRAAVRCAPHVLAHHLTRLAGLFHAYHAAHALVTRETALCEARVALAAAAGIVIRNGARLLGVSTPDSV
jgi:arginyl-tRNA synthetase